MAISDEFGQQLISIVEKTIENWKKENTEEKIKKEIVQRLDKAKDEVLPKLLGFNRRCGNKWELDHCNGRSGNSAIGDYLRKVQQATIEEWMRNITNFKLTAQQEADLKESARSHYIDLMRRGLQERIKKTVNEDLYSMVNQISKEMDADKYIAVLNLILPPKK